MTENLYDLSEEEHAQHCKDYEAWLDSFFNLEEPDKLPNLEKNKKDN